MGMVTAVDAVKALIRKLQSFQNDTTFDQFVQDAKAIGASEVFKMILVRKEASLANMISEMEERMEKGLSYLYLPLLLKKFQESDLEGLYPPSLHKIIRIAATLPVTTASCERCHSKVKIVNRYLRATMNEERLENLIIVSSEKDVASTIELPVLVHQFAIRPRKLLL
eukprot:gene13366-4221_t